MGRKPLEWSCDQDGGEPGWSIAKLVGEPHRQIEATLTFAYLTDPARPHRRDDVQHLVGRNAVATDCRPVHGDFQDRLTGHLFDRHIGRPGDRLDHRFDLPSLGLEKIEIFSEQLDPHVAAYAGDHFVDSHLDRLQEGHAHPGKIAQLRLHLVDQFFLGACTRPLVPWLQCDEHVREFDAHRVSRHLCRAGTRPDVHDLVGELLLQFTLDLATVTDGLRQRNFRQAHRVDHDGPF